MGWGHLGRRTHSKAGGEIQLRSTTCSDEACAQCHLCATARAGAWWFRAECTRRRRCAQQAGWTLRHRVALDSHQTAKPQGIGLGLVMPHRHYSGAPAHQRPHDGEPRPARAASISPPTPSKCHLFLRGGVFSSSSRRYALHAQVHPGPLTPPTHLRTLHLGPGRQIMRPRRRQASTVSSRSIPWHNFRWPRGFVL